MTVVFLNREMTIAKSVLLLILHSITLIQQIVCKIGTSLEFFFFYLTEKKRSLS